MSIPAINRYTHGTHITVAHAMVATIGINTMILLASIGYLIRIDAQSDRMKRTINASFRVSQVSLGIFWIALVIAGIEKGYRSVALGMNNFDEMMAPVLNALKLFSVAGVVLAAGLSVIAVCYIRILSRQGKPGPVITVSKKKEKLSYAK
jgi:nitric oxide reductase subunit B